MNDLAGMDGVLSRLLLVILRQTHADWMRNRFNATNYKGVEIEWMKQVLMLGGVKLVEQVDAIAGVPVRVATRVS